MTKQPSIARHPNYMWYVVGMLWFCGFFNYADRQAIFSVFPLLQSEMHLDKTQLGMLGSSFALVYGLFAPLAGNIVDHVRRKAAVLWGLNVWSIICMATALSRNYRHLLFFRAAEGLGESFYFPASMSLVSDYHGRATRSRAMGLHQTAVYFGTIAGGFFGGWISQRYGWRSSFVVFGGLGVVLGFVLAKLLVEPERGAADLEDLGVHHQPAHRMPIGEFLKVIWTTPTVLLCMGAFSLANFVAMVLLSWMPAFVFEKFHMSLAMSGLTATIFVQLAAMAGSPIGGWLADIWRRRSTGGRIAVQVIGMLGAAPFVWWCGQAPSVASIMLALTLWGLFKGIYDANIFASIFDVIRPEARGTAVGFMNLVGWLLGGAPAPVVIGAIAQGAGLGYAISAASVALVAGAALLAAAIRFTVERDAAKLRRQLET